MSTNSSKYLIYFLLIALVILNFFRANTVFPLPVGDGVQSIIGIINYLNDNGITNQITDWPTFYTPEDGLYSLAGYPLLHIYITSLFSYEASLKGVYFSLAVVNSLSLALITFSSILLINRYTKLHNKRIYMLLAFIMLVFFSNTYMGRPESSSILIISIACFFLITESHYKVIFHGILLGLVASTNPMVGFLYGTILLSYYAYIYILKDALKKYIISGLISILVFCIVLSSRYGLEITLNNMLNESSSQFGFWTSPHLFLYYNFLLKDKLLIGIPLIFSIILFTILPILSNKPKSYLAFYIGFILFTIGYYFAAIARPEPVYNIHALLPLAVMLTLYIIKDVPRIMNFAVLAWGLATSGFFIQIIAFSSYLKDGLQYSDAQQIFKSQETLLSTTSTIGVDGALWSITDNINNFNKFYTWNSGIKEHPQKNITSILLVQQMYAGDKNFNPPKNLLDEKRGLKHTLVANYFNKKELSILSINMKRTVPGYGFAIYKPN